MKTTTYEAPTSQTVFEEVDARQDSWTSRLTSEAKRWGKRLIVGIAAAGALTLSACNNSVQGIPGGQPTTTATAAETPGHPETQNPSPEVSNGLTEEEREMMTYAEKASNDLAGMRDPIEVFKYFKSRASAERISKNDPMGSYLKMQSELITATLSAGLTKKDIEKYYSDNGILPPNPGYRDDVAAATNDSASQAIHGSVEPLPKNYAYLADFERYWYETQMTNKNSPNTKLKPFRIAVIYSEGEAYLDNGKGKSTPLTDKEFYDELINKKEQASLYVVVKERIVSNFDDPNAYGKEAVRYTRDFPENLHFKTPPEVGTTEAKAWPLRAGIYGDLYRGPTVDAPKSIN